MGSPETELWRGEATEVETAVTLTHAFEIGQTEVTFGEWRKLGGVETTASNATDALKICLDDACPVQRATMFEAMEYANRLSQAHMPPFPSCYVMDGCNGTIGERFSCGGVATVTGSVYACKGYRLPTEAEWEYAARAGTRTAFYTGNITTDQVAARDDPEPNLDAIGWYSRDSEKTTHPVATKAPNQWMLFDMLGNVGEWTADDAYFAFPGGALTDPETPLSPPTNAVGNHRVVKGGNAGIGAYALRAASRDYPDASSPEKGFRLVRTLD